MVVCDKAGAKLVLEKFKNEAGVIAYYELTTDEQELVSACLCVLSGKNVIKAGDKFYCVE